MHTAYKWQVYVYTCYSEVGCPLCVKSDSSITDDWEPELHILNGCADGSWEHCLTMNKLERAVIGNTGWGRICLHCDFLRREEEVEENRKKEMKRRRKKNKQEVKHPYNIRLHKCLLCQSTIPHCLLTRIESGPSVMTSPPASSARILRGVLKGKFASADAPKAAPRELISSEAMVGTGGVKQNKIIQQLIHQYAVSEPWIHEEPKNHISLNKKEQRN